MTDLKNSSPATGEKITIREGILKVPDHPVVPFIEGDGTGPDIWRAAVRVLDACPKQGQPKRLTPGHIDQNCYYVPGSTKNAVISNKVRNLKISRQP